MTASIAESAGLTAIKMLLIADPIGDIHCLRMIGDYAGLAEVIVTGVTHSGRWRDTLFPAVKSSAGFRKAADHGAAPGRLARGRPPSSI